MIATVVVGYGTAGRTIHCPLIRRQPGMLLHGVVARDPATRSEAIARENARGYANIDEALADPLVDLVVIATPHQTHADLGIRVLEAGKHCIVDKVMAMSAAEADRLIAARDTSGKMLSVFHNRRWDWDFATVRKILADSEIGRPFLIESSVCRYAPARGWRRQSGSAGTLLHDWGAHLIDQALQSGLGPCRRLAAWITPAPWPDVETGGHGRIVLEFDGTVFAVENSRASVLTRPRWWVLGANGGFTKMGIDPQEDALRAGDIDSATELQEHIGHLRQERLGEIVDQVYPSVRAHWDGFYANIAAHLIDGIALAVTAEEAREVVRVLDAVVRSVAEKTMVEGPWGLG